MTHRPPPVAGAACITASLAVATAIARFGAPPFDASVGERSAELRDGAFGDVMHGLSWVGYAPQFAGLVVVVAMGLALAGRRIGAAQLVAVMLVSQAAFGTLKRLFGRERPEFAERVVGGFAMPSGHATMAFALMTTLLLVEPRLRTWWAAPVLAAYAVLTAVSRVVLGVHYLTDVVAGALLGTGCALVVVAASQHLLERRRAIG